MPPGGSCADPSQYTIAGEQIADAIEGKGPSVTRLITLFGLFLLLPTAATPSPSIPVARGQSPAEVRARLGPPLRVSRQVLFGRHVEQWVYEEPQPLRVEFSCVRGEEPYACAILQLSPAPP